MTQEPEEKLKWEWRIFWPVHDAACEKLADFAFTGLTPDKVETESHPDIYCQLPGSSLNIKVRDNALMIKQAMQKSGDYCGYEKKKTLSFPLAAKDLPFALPAQTFNTAQEFLAAVRLAYPAAQIVTVDKKRTSATFVRKGEDKKKLKAEYATIVCNGKTFQTLCLESKNRKWLESLVAGIDVTGGVICDYSGFFKLVAATPAPVRKNNGKTDGPSL